MKKKSLYYGYLLIELSLAITVFLIISVSLSKLINQSLYTLKKINEINEKILITNEIMFNLDRYIKEDKLKEKESIKDEPLEYNNILYNYNITLSLNEKLKSLYEFHIEILKDKKSFHEFQIKRFIPYDKK